VQVVVVAAAVEEHAAEVLGHAVVVVPGTAEVEAVPGTAVVVPVLETAVAVPETAVVVPETAAVVLETAVAVPETVDVEEVAAVLGPVDTVVDSLQEVIFVVLILGKIGIPLSQNAT